MEPQQTPHNIPNVPPNSPPLQPNLQQSPQPTPYQAGLQQPPYNPSQPMPVITGQSGSQAFRPTPTVVQPQAGAPIVMAPEPKKKKWLFIVIIVVLIVAAAIGGAYYFSQHKTQKNTATTTTHSYTPTENAALAALKQGGAALTSTSLDAINKDDLFYAVFRNASEQTTVTTTTNRYRTPQLNGTPLVSAESNIASISQGGYDYQHKQFSFQSNGSGVVDKCVGGVDYDAITSDSSPWVKSGAGNGDCQVANTTAMINDGLNTGGLSAAQAQQFVDTIRDINGLVDVTKTSIVTEQGKRYVRIDATINAHTDCYPNSVPSGAGCFGTAFSSLKLAKDWPDSLGSTIVSGAQLAYFVDPTTQLPAYMQIAYTPVTATQGNWENQQVQYSFGPLPTFQLVDGTLDPVTITWPVAQL